MANVKKALKKAAKKLMKKPAKGKDKSVSKKTPVKKTGGKTAVGHDAAAKSKPSTASRRRKAIDDDQSSDDDLPPTDADEELDDDSLDDDLLVAEVEREEGHEDDSRPAEGEDAEDNEEYDSKADVSYSAGCTCCHCEEDVRNIFRVTRNASESYKCECTCKAESSCCGVDKKKDKRYYSRKHDHCENIALRVAFLSVSNYVDKTDKESYQECRTNAEEEFSGLDSVESRIAAVDYRIRLIVL